MKAAVVLTIFGGERGKELLFLLVVVLVLLLWYTVVRHPIVRAGDTTERRILIGLLIVSVVLGGVIFYYPHHLTWEEDYWSRFRTSLLVTGAISLGVALTTRRVRARRALFVALLGDVFVPGALILMLFTGVAITGAELG